MCNFVESSIIYVNGSSTWAWWLQPNDNNLKIANTGMFSTLTDQSVVKCQK